MNVRLQKLVCIGRLLSACALFLAPIYFCVAQNATGVPAISTDRPGQSTPPGILTPGYVQIEAGFQLAGDKVGEGNAAVSTQTLSLPGALVRIGMLKSMELRLSTEYRSVKTTIENSDTSVSGITNLSVGTKIGITAEDGTIPETAFLLTLGLPVGSENFRPQNVAPGFLLAMHNTLSSSLNLYYNLGGNWDGANGAGVGLYSAALFATVNDKLSAFGELYGNTATGMMPVHAADAGLAYVAANNLQLDLFGGIGITSNAPDYFVNAGVSFRVPR